MSNENISFDSTCRIKDREGGTDQRDPIDLVEGCCHFGGGCGVMNP